ncbi:MAG TPA: AraC family transcriptional regulator, partial [Planctomycetota bacterium]|nr:AraC family transcriptional regulator [Planctomycetota bacterium]
RELLAGIPLSYRQLTRYFCSTTRQSPKQYQLQAKLIEAQRLLSETKLPVTTIALELGFPSSQHFASRYKHYFGRTPSAHRRRKRNNLLTGATDPGST